MSWRKKSGAAATARRTSTVPRWGSMLGAIKSSWAAKGWRGYASAMHLADCPRASTSRFFSSSATSTSVVPSPAISNRTWPGCTRSPGSAWRVSTVPATSARIVALSSCAWALASRAWALASWDWPGCSACACSWACSAARRARVSASMACSSASWLMACWLASRRRRSSSRRACCHCCCVCCTARWACGRVDCCSSVKAARAWRTWACRSSARSTASTSPGRTRSPSRTCRCSTTPVMGLPTCTRAGAVTRPVATTVCTRGWATTW